MVDDRKIKQRPDFPGAKGALPPERLEVPAFQVSDHTIGVAHRTGSIASNEERELIDRQKILSQVVLSEISSNAESSNLDRRVERRLVGYKTALEKHRDNVALLGIHGDMLFPLVMDDGPLDAGLAHGFRKLRDGHEALMSKIDPWVDFKARDKADLESAELRQQISVTIESVASQFEELSDHVHPDVVAALRSYDALSRDSDEEFGSIENSLCLSMAKVRMLENITIASVNSSIEMSKKMELDAAAYRPPKSWIGDEALSKLSRSGLPQLAKPLFYILGWMVRLFR